MLDQCSAGEATLNRCWVKACQTNMFLRLGEPVRNLVKCMCLKHTHDSHYLDEPN